MNFKEIVDENTILICGEYEELTREAIDILLISGIHQFYFVKPTERISNYLKEVVEANLLTFVDSVNQIDFKNFNLLICGFKPISELSNKLRASNHSVIIFFNQELGFFRALWDKLNYIKVYEQSLSKYILDNFVHQKDFAPKPKDTEEIFFTNRGESLKEHRLFISDESKICCKIIGMKGIGKQAFIKYLKLTQGISENCIEFFFINKDDDITYLLTRLLNMLGIPFKQDIIDNLQLDSKRVPKKIAELFAELDKLKNARIIFYNFDEIFNNKSKKFFDKNVGVFFHYILNRETYKGNKIYIVARENFEFPLYEDRNLTHTIFLKSLHPEQIQIILEHDFNTKGKNELAIAIMKYSFNTIDDLLGGHPQIAKLFVEACENYPMDSIINDPYFRKKFDKEKVAYLMNHIKLNAYEKDMLFFMSLFKANFEIDAIREKDSNPLGIIECLRNKLLLEKEDFIDGSSKYYIPSLIKDYSLSQIDKAIFISYHDIIAQYYWNKAEDIKTLSTQVLEAYRLAVYHFSEAKNTEKEKQLIMYFKGMFLNKASECYHKRDYGNAWHYYHELYQNMDLDIQNLSLYLTCATHTQLHNPDTEKLYEDVVKKHKDNANILASFAHYLFKRGDFEKAKVTCLEALKLSPNSYNVENLYPTILAKLGQSKLAIDWLKRVIKKYRYKSNLNKGNKNHLIALYINYYSILNYHEILKTTVSEVFGLLVADGVYFEDLNDLFFLKVDDDIDTIKEAFNKTINHKEANERTFFNYIKFLRAQGRIEEAQQILDKGKNKKIISENTQMNSIPIDILFNFSKRENIIKKGMENSIQEINRRIKNCESIMKKSYELIQNILTIESNNFNGIQISAQLLLHFKNLEKLKSIVNICYDPNKKATFQKKIAMKKTVFISYNHNDSDFVRSFQIELERANVQVILDTNTMKFGDGIKEFIEKSVRHSNFTIPVISKNSLKSPWVLMECLEALMYEKVEQQKMLIPIYIDNSVFDYEFFLEAINSIQENINELNILINEAINIDKNCDISLFDTKRDLLLNLKNNLGKLLKNLNEKLIADFSSEEKVKENLPKLVEIVSNINEEIS